MNLQDFESPLDIRDRHYDLPVKPSRSQQGGIEYIGSIGGCKDDDSFIAFKTVHLHEELVKGLFPFIMSSAEACTPVSPDSVDLIDEDDAGSALLCLIEEVSHP